MIKMAQIKNKMEIVIGFLESNYEDFQIYLEILHEIEGTEAELIIAELKKGMK